MGKEFGLIERRSFWKKIAVNKIIQYFNIPWVIKWLRICNLLYFLYTVFIGSYRPIKLQVLL